MLPSSSSITDPGIGCRLAMTVLSREDPTESMLKTVPPAQNLDSVEIIYPVRSHCSASAHSMCVRWGAPVNA